MVSITRSLTPQGLADVLSIAQDNAVREVWLFGSAAAPDRQTQPRDVDVALVGVRSYAKASLTRQLKRRFPAARIEDALQYSKQRHEGPTADVHFVLVEDAFSFNRHPIAHSVRAGVCLWAG